MMHPHDAVPLSFLRGGLSLQVISNCVINLSPDKDAVLQGTYNALREGGELYFSDVYSDRRIPEAVRQHKVLWGECLSGALYIEDFKRICHKVGFSDPRQLSKFQHAHPGCRLQVAICSLQRVYNARVILNSFIILPSPPSHLLSAAAFRSLSLLQREIVSASFAAFFGCRFRFKTFTFTFHGFFWGGVWNECMNE